MDGQTRFASCLNNARKCDGLTFSCLGCLLVRFVGAAAQLGTPETWLLHRPAWSLNPCLGVLQLNLTDSFDHSSCCFSGHHVHYSLPIRISLCNSGSIHRHAAANFHMSVCVPGQRMRSAQVHLPVQDTSPAQLPRAVTPVCG